MGYKTHVNVMYSQTHNERQKGCVRKKKSLQIKGLLCKLLFQKVKRSKASNTKGRFVPPNVYSLRQEKVVEIPHPPYSPYLAPCDYVLFPRFKSTLLGENTKYENTLVQSSSSVSRLYKEKTMKLLSKI